jgi:hypothetical protein
MYFRIGSAIVSLALAVSMAAVALAQADDDPPPAVDQPTEAAAPDLPAVAPTLFLRLDTPAERDVEVPLETVQLTVQGATLPGAVVSIDGDLVDTDDQGGFIGITALDEGANEIEIVASDGDGNQISTTLYVVRADSGE